MKGEDKPLRPLLYARPVHSQFALLSFFIEEDEQLAEGEQSIRQFLDELLGIQELVSVLFIMREPQPPWKSKEGDKRFWNARGVVSQSARLISTNLALAPMRLNVRVTPEFASTRTLEHLYLYLPSVKDLKQLAAITMRTSRNSSKLLRVPISPKFSAKYESAYKGAMRMAL